MGAETLFVWWIYVENINHQHTLLELLLADLCITT